MENFTAKPTTKPFNQEWWDTFYEDSHNMTIPKVVPGAFDKDVSVLRETVFEMLQNLSAEQGNPAWRVWVDGKLEDNFKEIVKNDPIKGHEDLTDWQKRNFGDKKFGIILNNGHKYSSNARRIISEKFAPYLKNNIPVGGINFSTFFGNYGWTPLGIHQDHTGSFVMHFHLGPGKKTMYMWEADHYKQLKGKMNEDNAEKYLPYADYTLEFGTGDVFFMPWNYYHIGKADELSLSITVWFNYTTVDGLLNGVWESGMKEVDEDIFDHNSLIPNIKTSEYDKVIERLLSQLDEDVLDTRLNRFIKDQVDDYTTALKSNEWYDNGDLKHKKKSVRLKTTDVLTLNQSKIEINSSGETIKLFHRGDKISFHNHEDIIQLIGRLNENQPKAVSQLTEGLFDDWPEEVSLRLLEILCENDILHVKNI